MMRAVRFFLAMIAVSAAASFAQEDLPCPAQWKSYQPLDSHLQICWNIDGDWLQVEMSHPGQVWMALGFGSGMAGADAVIGRPDTGTVVDAFIGSYDAASIVPDARQDITDHSVVFADGYSTVKFSRALNTGDETDHIVTAGQPMPIIWAVGAAPGFSAHHNRGVITIDWGAGASFAWNTTIVLHAVLMAAAWLLLMPLGVIIARYYKVLPKQDFPRRLDNQFWWHWHLLSQFGGMLCAAVGFFLYGIRRKISADFMQSQALLR